MAKNNNPPAGGSKVDFSGKKPVFSWQTPEFITYQRDSKWVIGIIVAAIGLAAILATQKQWTGVGMILVAAVIFITISNTKPKNIGCAVFDEGIVVDGKVYNYDQFKSFWFVDAALSKIKFQLIGRFAGQVAMPLGDIDFDQVRLFLAKHLPEEDEQREDLNDIINRLFRL